MIQKFRLMVFVATAAASVNALAAVSADEAKQLGGATLTIWGAEKAGNKDGTIPPYTGEMVKSPPGNVPGEYSEPWNEKPLFTITAQNYTKYADKLDAQVELFKKFPNYRMDIYPTHRTTVLPKHYLDNTLKNATSCKTDPAGNALEGCYGGVPFPIAKTGAEMMWNHLFTWNGYFNKANFMSYVVSADGTVTLQSINEAYQKYPMFDPTRTTPAKPDDVFWGYRSDLTAPARRRGEKLLILDAVDNLRVGRRVWQYIPGQRRVKLAPDLAYDTPNPNGGGALAIDEAKGFLGALDRYEWKLIGKKEKFIMSNNFKVEDFHVCPVEKLYTKGFPNPDCVRWELRRVWQVEGKLRPGFRHIYPRRVLYWDEDGYAGGTSENYDASGHLYRFITVISYPYYDATGFDSGATFGIDLQTGVWASNGLCNGKGMGFWALPPMTKEQGQMFTPESMAAEGIR